MPPKVLLLSHPSKPAVVAALPEVRHFLATHATLVGERQTTDQSAIATLPEADFAVVLGGDGTILAAARGLVQTGHDTPILGVNFGKLGFLAEFSQEEMLRHWHLLASGHYQVRKRLLLQAAVHQGETVLASGLAMNDATLVAGEPFRMVDLELRLDPEGARSGLVQFSGDGVVVCTPSGSTAYNLSAGGPIIAPGTEAFGITPLNPHSLAFRPFIVPASTKVELKLLRANPGSALVLDGIRTQTLCDGMRVSIARHPRAVRLIQNPERTYWEILSGKLHWAARPQG